MGGIVVVESLFGFHGFGKMMLDASLNKDVAVIEAGAWSPSPSPSAPSSSPTSSTALNPRIHWPDVSPGEVLLQDATPRSITTPAFRAPPDRPRRFADPRVARGDDWTRHRPLLGHGRDPGAGHRPYSPTALVGKVIGPVGPALAGTGDEIGRDILSQIIYGRR